MLDLRERKTFFIKCDISTHIDSSSGDVEALISFVIWTITEKDTFFGSELKFVLVVGS